MLAIPVFTHKQKLNGPRPIDLSKDVRQVLTLLDASFGPMLGGQGRRLVSDRVSLTYGPAFGLKLSMFTRGFKPGFVWEENGRVIGNVTLLESQMAKRYLVANVAVHPDHRRRGIARALMRETIDHVDNLHGNSVLLQVESTNEAAIDLYLTLGFDILGTMGLWESTAGRLRTIQKDQNGGINVRPLRSSEWSTAFKLDQATVKPDLSWPTPLDSDFYKVTLWRRINDLLNGRKSETWVTDTRSQNDGKWRLTGLANLSTEWGRPYLLRIRTVPSWRGRLERSLFASVLHRFLYRRGNKVKISHPVDDEIMNQLLQEANFILRRKLTMMRLSLL